MVVNPQTFNYRLAIGTLIVAMLGLGAYSFSSYNKLKAQKEFLIEEKKIVEHELSKIVTRYDELMFENDAMKDELSIAKERTLQILDSLKVQEATVYILSKYRGQIASLQKERTNFMTLANTLKTENQKLDQERKNVFKRLEKQTGANDQLHQRNQLLAENLVKGSEITANSFMAKAFKIKTSGKSLETDKARRADLIKVCFVLAKNALAETGKKELYIQILDPSNNVIGDKSSKNFGDYTLIYSTKSSVNYDNDVLDICVKAATGKDKNVFLKGTYFINVFHDEKKLGSTTINLN